MLARHIGLLALLLFAFGAFTVAASTSPDWSVSDVVSYVVFAIVFVYVVLRLLAIQGKNGLEGQSKLPRFLRVAFASFALAFALGMLLSMVTMPWFGLQAFKYLLGQEAWWSLPLVAAILYPLVRLRLH